MVGRNLSGKMNGVVNQMCEGSSYTALHMCQCCCCVCIPARCGLCVTYLMFSHSSSQWEYSLSISYL